MKILKQIKIISIVFILMFSFLGQSQSNSSTQNKFQNQNLSTRTWDFSNANLVQSSHNGNYTVQFNLHNGEKLQFDLEESFTNGSNSSHRSSQFKVTDYISSKYKKTKDQINANLKASKIAEVEHQKIFKNNPNLVNDLAQLQQMQAMKANAKDFFTSKGITNAYLGQSFMFLFWLGAAQLYTCINDYSLNPMACYQYLMSEADPIHRTAFVAFVVTSGLVHNIPYLFNLFENKSYKKNFTKINKNLSHAALGMGMMAQGIVQQVLTYYLQDPDVKKCASLASIKKKIAEEKRFTNSPEEQYIYEENNPCRLAEDKTTMAYLKNRMPPEMLGLFFTIPATWAVETALGAVAPGKLMIALQRVIGFSQKSVAANAVPSLGTTKLLIRLETLSHNISDLQKLVVSIKSGSKIINLASGFVKSGVNLLIFTALSEHIFTPAVNEMYYSHVTSTFKDNSESLSEAFSDLNKYQNVKLTSKDCSYENCDLDRPLISKKITDLRNDFVHWRELKISKFMMTFQGWQQKVEKLIHGYRAFELLATQLITKYLTYEDRPWSKPTSLRGVVPLVPYNIKDEEILVRSPHEYYGPLSERAFVVGMGLRLFLENFYLKSYNEKISTSFQVPTLDIKIKAFIDEQKNIISKSSTLATRDREMLKLQKVISAGQNAGRDMTEFINVINRDILNSIDSSSNLKIIEIFKTNNNPNFKNWLKKLYEVSLQLTNGFFININNVDPTLFIDHTVGLKLYMTSGQKDSRTFSNPIYDDVRRLKGFDWENPLRMYGMHDQLIDVIEKVSKEYFKTLGETPYFYYLPQQFYPQINLALDYLVDLKNSFGSTDSIESVSGKIVNLPVVNYFEDIGWVSRKSVFDVLRFLRVFIQLDYDYGLFYRDSTKSAQANTSYLAKIVNTLDVGLGSIFKVQSEGEAFKKRFQLYSSLGRNQDSYNFPLYTNKIRTETAFDSIVVGMICGKDTSDESFRVSFKNSNVNNKDLQLSDLMPDQFSPFKLFKPDSEIIEFCSRSISDSKQLDSLYGKVFYLFEKKIKQVSLDTTRSLNVEKYGSAVVKYYCSLVNSTDDVVAIGPWAQFKKRYCSLSDDKIVLNSSDLKILINSTELLISELSKISNITTESDRLNSIQQLIELYKNDFRGWTAENFDKKLSQEDEMYKQIKINAFLQVLTLKGVSYLKNVMDKYQSMYDSKLYLLNEYLYGNSDEFKNTMWNNIKFKISDYYKDQKDLFSRYYKNQKPTYLNKINRDELEDKGSLSMIQEGSYYIAMLSRLYEIVSQRHINKTYPEISKLNENQRVSLIQSGLLPTLGVQPLVDYVNKPPQFESVLISMNSVDTQLQLPQAMPFAWRMNDLLKNIFYHIAHNDLEQTQKTLSELDHLVSHLKLNVFSLDGSNGNLDQELQKKNLEQEDLNKLIPVLDSTFISENEKQIAQTVIIHLEGLINDIGSTIGMITPLRYDQVQQFNGVNN